MVSASRRSTLYSGDYAIEIAPGAIVHATRYGSVLKIRNLCDTAGNAVRLTIGDSKVSLSPGEELVVGPDLATAEAAVKSDNVGRRNARRYVIDSKRAIVKTELSITALIQRNSLLLMTKRDWGHQKAMAH